MNALQIHVALPKRRRRKLPVRPITVTVAESKKLSGLGNTKIYELIGDGTLESVTVGRRRLIVLASLERMLGSEAQEAA